MPRIFFSLITVLLMLVFSACGQDHAHVEAEAHEHGPDSHTHGEAVATDTAGTYVDSTAAFFGEDDDDHEHGPETHEHDDDHQ